MINYRTILLTACLAAACGAQTFADTITLRRAVRMEPGATAVTLADIAEIDGAEAMRYADLPIAQWSDSAGVIEIAVRDVRRKLDEAAVHWGRVNLSGWKVIVRPSRAGDAEPPMAMTPIALESADVAAQPTLRESSSEECDAAQLIQQPTLRGAIASMIVSNMQRPAADVRLQFDREDHELLETPLLNQRFEIHPLGSFASDRLEFRIRLWTNNQPGPVRPITVLPMLRVSAAVARHDLQKDQVISDADLDTAEHWLPPSQAAMAVSRVQAVGRIAERSMKAGEILRDRNLRRNALIKRGDLVVVRCLVGGVAISLQAEAKADGAQGDVIEFRKQGERDTFLATVAGRGEAVLDLSRR